MSIDVLLFDLGGVLVEFSGVRDVAPFLRERLSESEIWSAGAIAPIPINSALASSVNRISANVLYGTGISIYRRKTF